MKIKSMISKRINNNLVIKGTLILTLTGLAARILGFYNRIFLSGLIGAKELGIYQLIFPLYIVAFALTTFGNELALTKLVSEYNSLDRAATAKAFFKVCFTINLILGCMVSFLMHHFSDWLCSNILNAPECSACLKVISFGVPFMAMKGAIHGYFLGLEKSEVHGISDFLEQFAKVFVLSFFVTNVCIRESYDAAFAVWGIVIGEIVSFLYSAISFIRYHVKNSKSSHPLYSNRSNYEEKNCNANRSQVNDLSCSAPLYTDQIVRIFLKTSIPMTTNRLALTVMQSIEAILIPTVLLVYYKDSAFSLSTYGIFTGMAFPFIMFPATVTNSLSTMLMPAVSSANSALKKNYLKRLCEQSLHFCLLIGLFSTVLFYIFGSTLGTVFFHNEDAGRYLIQLSFLCPLIYLSTTLASILNGLGYAPHNLMLTILSTLIRIAFILTTIPRIGMSGYILGLFVSYLFQSLASLSKLHTKIPVELKFTKSILRPCIPFILLGILSFHLYKYLMSSISKQYSFLILIFVIGSYGTISLLPFLMNTQKK